MPTGKPAVTYCSASLGWSGIGDIEEEDKGLETSVALTLTGHCLFGPRRTRLPLRATAVLSLTGALYHNCCCLLVSQKPVGSLEGWGGGVGQTQSERYCRPSRTSHRRTLSCH